MCQSFGGTLISIHSAEENYFALHLANRDGPMRYALWIGAKRNNSVDYFEWTNGQELNYSNWHRGEPKNITDPESEVLMYISGTWAANGKNMYRALFMCESDSSDE
jgi:hypothetical protein